MYRKYYLRDIYLPPLGMLAVTAAVGMLMGRGIYMLMSVIGTMRTTVFSIVKFI